MRPLKVLPSILSSDFSMLGEEVGEVMAAGGDIVHIDIMDGHFVPNISFGPQVMQAIRHVTAKPFDVHLMIAPVDPYLADFAAAGADRLTVHVEAGPHLHRSLQAVRALGKSAGVAINPATPASAIAHVLDLVDLVLVMSVNPGFGGQSFITDALDKIRAVREMTRGREIEIEVDGGIGPDTAGAVAAAGANYLVAGSAIFKGGAAAYQNNIAAIREPALRARGESV